MAGKQSKFDRNRTRSPSMKSYRASRRDIINKVRKLKRHCAEHPEDLRSKSALTTLLSGKSLPPATFPITPRIPDKHKPDGMQELEVEYRKHEVKYGQRQKDGRRARLLILQEKTASGPLYWVESGGVVKEVTPSLEEAEKTYNKSHSSCVLLQRRGTHTSVLRNKPATPVPGSNRQLYAGWKL